jgi:hypothetical protein
MSAMILEPRCTVLDFEFAVEVLTWPRIGYKIRKPSFKGLSFLSSYTIAGATVAFGSVVYSLEITFSGREGAGICLLITLFFKRDCLVFSFWFSGSYLKAS